MSTQRSGSGWFETLLNSHINISSNGEIFSVKVRKSNVSTILDTLDKLYNLDFFTSASKNECTAAVGLKWMLNQVRASWKLWYNCYEIVKVYFWMYFCCIAITEPLVMLIFLINDCYNSLHSVIVCFPMLKLICQIFELVSLV